MTREEALNTLMKMRAWRAWGKEQKEEERPEMPEQKEVDEAFDVCIELLQQSSLPSNLDEAARQIVIKMHPYLKDCTILGDRLTSGQLMALVKAGAEWQKEQDQETIELAEEHAMLAGRMQMKEEMMKDAVDAIVENWNPDPEPEITIPLNPEEFTPGDKVRIIIVKEDER